ncbi:rubrerythrin [Fibrobacterales bacterium]|nr:rubrerythrin [Fibrobacterales bacterium]
MSKDIKGTQTEKNLLTAFAGESQARNRYTFWASVAKKENLMQISAIFEETAAQEKEHAERFWSFLQGGAVEITAAYPAGMPEGGTLENLRAAADGENEEWSVIYPKFAEIAKEEGFADVAACFRMVSIAEKQHEKRYNDLYNNLKDGKVFKRDGKVVWRCRNCGFLHEAAEAPKVCPACLHPQAYFELLGENW